jgi:hypothetical protein
MHATASFKSSKVHYLMFEGVVDSYGGLGDIALDDLHLQREKCQTQPELARPVEQASDLISCDFEDQTTCKWKNEPPGDFSRMNWLIGQGPSEDSGRTGPKGGALDSSYYLFVNSRKNAKGARARLTSPFIPRPDAKGYCLSLYYHMFGEDMADLVISAVTANTRNITTIFERLGGQVDKWLRGLVKLNREDFASEEEFQFWIDTELITYYSGGM